MTSGLGIRTLRGYPGNIVNSIPITLTEKNPPTDPFNKQTAKVSLGNSLSRAGRSWVCPMALPIKDSLILFEVEKDGPFQRPQRLIANSQMGKNKCSSCTSPDSGLQPMLGLQFQILVLNGESKTVNPREGSRPFLCDLVSHY